MAKPEGRTLPFVGPEKVDIQVLETFPYEGPVQTIRYKTSEFSSVCPFSGLPDIADVEVEYVPAKKIIELKSLKYYFMSYRDVGIYQEHANAKVFQDLFKCLEPRSLIVRMKYNTRGGIDAYTEVSSQNQ
jgi:7-cyano-7-deazaguanine reductase